MADAIDSARDGTSAGEVFEECLRRKVGPGHFYDLRHAEIWSVIAGLASEGRPADMLLLIEALRSAHKLEAVGGVGYIGDIADGVPSAHNIGFYLDDLLDKHTRREVLRLCTKTSALVHEHDGPVADLVGTFEADALKLSETHVSTEFFPITQCVPAYIDAIEERHRGKQAITGLETPWWYLNNITCGLQPRELVVIGARPSTGKTAWALAQIAHAQHIGTGCLFFSIEMARQEIMGRLVAMEARVDGIKLRNGFWRESKEQAITDAAGRIATWDKFFIDDRSVINGQDVFVAARRAQRQHGIGLVVVDYLQLMQPVARYSNRNEAVAEISGWLKRTAKELQIPVIACAQLSRDSEKERGGKAPLMSDLRECGNIEQDADVIGLLWEPKLQDDDFDDMKWLSHHTPDDPKDDSAWNDSGSDTVCARVGGGKVEVNRGWRDEFKRINLTIAKNRNGQTGPCELVFQRRSTRFVDAHSPQRVKEERGTLI